MPGIARGIYENLITEELEGRLSDLNPDLIHRQSLEPGEAHDTLARHIATLTRRALRSLSGDNGQTVARQVDLANLIATAIADATPDAIGRDDLIAASHEMLLAIVERDGTPGPIRFPVRPEVPLSTSVLLVNGQDQPRIGYEVARELASADSVDLLCAFIKWHGLRVLETPIRELRDRDGRLRVITTTYIGATEQRALDRLAELGAEVKVSYETRTTRLHAKAWLFRRETGLSTAYVGSSNLSKTALVDGLEWNVRLSSVEQSHLLNTFADTFESYWADTSFESYDPVRDRERLGRALSAERGGPADLPLQITSLDVRPYGYQREILDELSAERELHDRWRNLVVMATGTGKTVVAALDYCRLREARTAETVLFVAHRDEILSQSQATFRHVLHRGDFGERLVGGERPSAWRHVFASIQSLAKLDLSQLRPEQFDVVIVDEFHHSMAPTYARLLNHLKPKVLLGLTATPERSDGTDVRSWFGGRTAVELRLWEALERGLLAPFQYFGTHDGVALEQLRWKRGRGYDASELSNVYTGDDHRVRLILQSVKDKITDPGAMRALGFCVSIDHAEFMARRFTESGIPSRAITSKTKPDERAQALKDLADRAVNVLFTVDLFNEGIDLPAIDTVLFLRPTESATIFLQQLGRGLRLANDKPCLTVLDFIGAQHQEFRFDLRYRALTGATRRGLVRELELGFPTLPAGCHIELDRVARDLVLANLRRSLQIPWPKLAAELRAMGDCTLSEFLIETGIEVDDLYRTSRGGWPALRRLAGLETPKPGADDERLGRAIGRLLHLDDPERLSFIRQMLTSGAAWRHHAADPRSQRLAAMLHFALWGANEPVSKAEEAMQRLLENPARQQELLELTVVLGQGIRRLTPVLDAASTSPLHVHARYSRDEVLAAFGVNNPASVRQGIKWVDHERADLFFVTLRKTETHFSPTTMYADHAISPNLFQWESQSTTTERSLTGQRYIHHHEQGSSVHLFIRQNKEQDGALGAPPYLYAGPMSYVDHHGERPMKIRWELDRPLPADMFHAAKVASG
jgi:superfamily II DNA or RNA helicase